MSVNVQTIAAQIGGRTATDIAASIARAIRAGEIASGSSLPTVRNLADALDISPSTVSDAWRTLRHYGLIETDRRRGTTVRANRPFGSALAHPTPRCFLTTARRSAACGSTTR